VRDLPRPLRDPFGDLPPLLEGAPVTRFERIVALNELGERATAAGVPIPVQAQLAVCLTTLVHGASAELARAIAEGVIRFAEEDLAEAEVARALTDARKDGVAS
jgi:hypothetical protein